MEDLPKSLDQKTSSHTEASEARTKYATAQKSLRNRIFMPHVATALERDEESWKVVLIVEKERHEKRARKLATRCIADTPVSVLVMGPARAI